MANPRKKKKVGLSVSKEGNKSILFLGERWGKNTEKKRENFYMTEHASRMAGNCHPLGVK